VFERYTESARRALFFSRYEASRLGAHSIETEHLLLALLRERAGIVDRIFDDHALTYVDVASGFHRGNEQLPTSVEIPFTAQVKRGLITAMEEADRLSHRNIEPEHLLLGLLHEPESVAGRILAEHGLRLPATRDQVMTLLSGPGASIVVRTEVQEVLTMVDTIEILVGDLLSLPGAQGLNASRALPKMIPSLRERLRNLGK
jgi:ATP-dependent Clp protease ATP-binding subunit ClpC